MHTIYRVSLHSLAWFSWTCQGDLKYSASRLRRNQEERWLQWMIQYPTQTKQTKYLKLSVFRQCNYKYRKCVLNIKFEWSIITQHKTILVVQSCGKIQCRALLWASAKALCLCKSARLPVATWIEIICHETFRNLNILSKHVWSEGYLPYEIQGIEYALNRKWIF